MYPRLNRRSFVQSALTASAVATFAHTNTIAQTPVSGSNNLFLAHNARLTAAVPDGYTALPGSLDGLWHGPPAVFLAVSSSGANEDEAVANALLNIWGIDVSEAAPTPITIAGQTGTGYATRQYAVACVPHPVPFLRDGIQMDWAIIAAPQKHHVAIFDSISFDLSSITGQQYLTPVINFARENFIDRDDIDWSAIDAAAASVTDIDSAHAVLTEHLWPALKAAGEHHGRLITPDSATSPAATPIPGATPIAEATPFDFSVFNDTRPTGSIIADGVGYIELPAYTGADYVAYVQAGRDLIEDLADAGACSFMIDLRYNRGGSAGVMIGSLLPLYDPKSEAIGFASPDGTQTLSPLQYFSFGGLRGEFAFTPGLSSAPTAILFGPWTASSGELTAMSFIGRPNTMSFGGTTRGATTSLVWAYLIDDWTLAFSNSAMTDGQGNRYPDGITPDIIIDSSSAEAPTSDAADEINAAAIDWLQNQGCSVDATPMATPAP